MILDRRDFPKLGAAASVGTMVGGAPLQGTGLAASAEPTGNGKRPLIWGNLVHLNPNRWCDWYAPELKGDDSIFWAGARKPRT